MCVRLKIDLGDKVMKPIVVRTQAQNLFTDRPSKGQPGHNPHNTE